MKSKITRSLLTISFLLAFVLHSAAQEDTAIHFNRVPFANIFKESKDLNKPIMLYFHVDGCGACIQLERGAFKHPDIYTYINKNFIVYNINTSKGEGIEINRKYHIVLNPTILFLNEKGTVIDRVEGYARILNLYDHLKKAVAKTEEYTEYKKEYKRGNRDNTFLYRYTYILDQNGDLTSDTVVNEYLASIKPRDLMSEKNIGYMYDFMYYDKKVMIHPKSEAFQLIYNNRNIFAQRYSYTQIDSRIIFVLYKEIEKAPCGSPDFAYLFNMIKPFQGWRLIGVEEPDGEVSERISEIDTTAIYEGFSRCLLAK